MAFSASREHVIKFIEWYWDNVEHPAKVADIITRAAYNDIPEWKLKQVSGWLVTQGRLIKTHEFQGQWYWGRVNKKLDFA